MTPVRSSNIEAVGYDQPTRVLTVRFKSGQAHAYDGVSPEHHAALMRAESVGKHFHAHIRSAFASRRVVP